VPPPDRAVASRGHHQACWWSHHPARASPRTLPNWSSKRARSGSRCAAARARSQPAPHVAWRGERRAVPCLAHPGLRPTLFLRLSVSPRLAERGDRGSFAEVPRVPVFAERRGAGGASRCSRLRRQRQRRKPWQRTLGHVPRRCSRSQWSSRRRVRQPAHCFCLTGVPFGSSARTATTGRRAQGL
jgi:hypothetical protein